MVMSHDCLPLAESRRALAADRANQATSRNCYFSIYHAGVINIWAAPARSPSKPKWH